MDTLVQRLRTITASFTPVQLASLAGAFVLVVAVVGGSAMWANTPNYVLLFADLEPEAAADLVTKLKAQKTPYKLDEGGRAIRVPANRVDELRLELTADGLPESGRIGFEIFDRTAFGATEFLEKINYRRALEGEIARTIATIREVASARVHIAMGKDTLFGDPRPAKASVILKLRGQRTLATSTISGITNLVAGSVEGLRPEAVVILDSYGRPLAQPRGDDGDPMGAAQVERQQRLERDMATRVVAMLEPIVGESRVRVNVAMRLNPQRREETEEHWDPNTAIRSHQIATDTASAPMAGVAGTRANMPQPATGTQTPPSPPGVPPTAAGPTSSRNAETTNYEVSRVTRHTLQPPGEIARLSVAVILDDDQVIKAGQDGTTTATRKPRSREELQKIQGLVAAAVGLETGRGDQLTVENVSFEEPPPDMTPAPTMLERYAPQLWEGGRLLVAALIGLAALMMFLRPLMRKVAPAGRPNVHVSEAGAAALPESATAPPRTLEDIEQEIEAQLDASTTIKGLESRKLPVLKRRATALSTKEPENVAKLFRSWLQEQESNR